MNELFLTVVLEQVEAATANAILEAKLLSISLISSFLSLMSPTFDLIVSMINASTVFVLSVRIWPGVT